MNFKQQKLALAIGIALLPMSVMANVPALNTVKSVANSTTSLVKQSNETGFAVYRINLKSKAALAQSNRAKGDHYKLVAQQLKAEQDQFYQAITALDGNAVLLGTSQLLSNSLTLVMSNEAAASLSNNASVTAVIKDRDLDSAAYAEQLQKAKLKGNTALLDEDETSLYPDYSKVVGVKVGIIGTGIDYTHKKFGGAGTVEEYELAAEYNYIPDPERFPNDIFFGGVDVFNEQGQDFDYNPIERKLANPEAVSHYYPAGQGTQMASVILDEAPDAKLFPIKVYATAIFNNGQEVVVPPSLLTMMDAFEWAIDPNGDGDVSDKLDIVTVSAETALVQGGCWNYTLDWPAAHVGTACAVFMQAMKVVTANGVLVVGDAGFDFPSSEESEYAGWATGMPYNMSSLGALPGALISGNALLDETGTFTVADTSRIGPVRMSGIIKPDLVSVQYSSSVAVLGGGEQVAELSHGRVSAARMAGIAAKLMAARPELNAQEIKALLLNTANHNVMAPGETATVANIIQTGAGVANIEAAISSPIVAMEKNTFQTQLNFGFVETDSHESLALSKEIIVRNLSEQALTYDVAISMPAEHSGLSWSHPATVTIAAGMQVSFTATLTIDPTQLRAWSMNDSNTVNLQGYLDNAATGVISLTKPDAPQVDLGWRVMARPGSAITKDIYSHHISPILNLADGPGNVEYWQPAVEHFGQDPNGTRNLGLGSRQQFSNTSAQEKTFAVYPMIKQWGDERPTIVSNPLEGILMESLGGGIYPEASCASGEKLSLALVLNKPLDILASKRPVNAVRLLHASEMFRVFALPEAWVEQENWRTEHVGYVTQPPVISERGFAVSFGLDENNQLSAYYDAYGDPAYRDYGGRIRNKSQLAVEFQGHGNTVIGHWCTDELAHNDLTVDNFDQDFAWAAFTDVDEFPVGKDTIDWARKWMYQDNPYQMMPLFNPVAGGTPAHIEHCKFMDPTDCYTGVYDRDYWVTMNKLDSEGNDDLDSVSHRLTLQPGETAWLNSFRTDGRVLNNPESHSLMFLSMDDNTYIRSYSGPAYKDDAMVLASVKDGQVITVTENTPAGTIIGRIELHSDGFFGRFITHLKDIYNFITPISPIEQDAVTVQEDGFVVVNNAAALDYEARQSISFDVVVAMTNRSRTRPGTVTINIVNINDNAPVQLGELNFTVEQNGTVDLRIAALFSDADGDLLKFSATGLPQGLAIDSNSGVIKGTIAEHGEFTATLTVNDGENSAKYPLKLSVTKTESSSNSGGSMSIALMTLLGLVGLGRRKLRK